MELSSRAAHPDPSGRKGGSPSRTEDAFYFAPYPGLLFSPALDEVAVNDAAERLFGHNLGLIIRAARGQGPEVVEGLAGVLQALPTRAGALKRRGVAVRLPDRPAFKTDLVAGLLPDGRVLVTFLPRAQPPVAERQAETLRSAAGMGRTLAHEVKNPLAGIRGAAQLLEASAGPEDRALAQLIVDETDRIRRLIDRVEAFSDERPSECAPVNIHRVLDRVRAVVTAGAGDAVTVREAYDPSLPDALGDQDQLVQIFLNLVKNAAEAARARDDGGGDILLSTAYRARGRESGADGPPAPLEICVQDNGPGVAPILREHLFEPFITTKPQGAGLGLTLVAKLVAAHGGEITFDSEPGRTVFRVNLPVAPPTPETSA